MKKFLLSLIALAGIATTYAAETVTFDFANETYGLTRETENNASYIDNGTKLTVNGGVEITLTKKEGSNGWRLWKDGLRAYKNSDAGMTITATGHKITKVTIKQKSGVITKINSTAVSGAELVYPTPGDATVTLSFNVAANGPISTMDVELDGEGGTVEPTPDPEPDPTPDPVETVGDGTEAKPFTVADVLALNNTKAEAAWVKGYIVGSSNNGGTLELTPADSTQSVSNILIADSATETDLANIIAVQLPSKTDIRTALNLVDNPGNRGKVLEIKGDLTPYFGDHPGVKNPTAYKLDGQGSTPVDPTPDPTPEVPTTGPGSADQPYTIAEAMAKNNDKSLGWVNGYIVGVMLYDEVNKHNYFSTTVGTQDTNIVIAATATETDSTKMMAVQLPKGKVRDDLNLVARPGNMGKEVSVCGSLESYCGLYGVKNTSDYSIVGGLAPLPTGGDVATLTDFIEEQPDKFTTITGAVTVFYQSPDKQYTFITDGTSNLEVYGTLPEYHNGDQLTGISGKYGYFQNMPQMAPNVDSFGEATEGTPVEPTEVAFNQIQIAQYVKVIAIDIYKEDGKFYFGQGEAKRQIFDRFNLGGLKEGICTVTGIGAIYGSTPQIFPTDLDYKTSSIEEITATGAKTEIYDLQGRKVSNATRGMYIINGKKTLVR